MHYLKKKLLAAEPLKKPTLTKDTLTHFELEVLGFIDSRTLDGQFKEDVRNLKEKCKKESSDANTVIRMAELYLIRAKNSVARYLLTHLVKKLIDHYQMEKKIFVLQSRKPQTLTIRHIGSSRASTEPLLRKEPFEVSIDELRQLMRVINEPNNKQEFIDSGFAYLKVDGHRASFSSISAVWVKERKEKTLFDEFILLLGEKNLNPNQWYQPITENHHEGTADGQAPKYYKKPSLTPPPLVYTLANDDAYEDFFTDSASNHIKGIFVKKVDSGFGLPTKLN